LNGIDPIDLSVRFENSWERVHGDGKSSVDGVLVMKTMCNRDCDYLVGLFCLGHFAVGTVVNKKEVDDEQKKELITALTTAVEVPFNLCTH
jgi:hypothetical protein